jgi:hypothetical protein
MPRDFVIGCGEYSIECTPSGLPGLYDLLKAHAALAEEIALDERDLCCLAVRRGAEAWPFLTVALGCGAAAAGGSPGALLALDAGTLFIGYGTRALAIRMHPLGRLWSSDAPGGFRFWEQHGEVVLLGAETALAGFSLAGDRLWTRPVSPPWSHRVRGESLELTDGGGRAERLSLRDGGPLAPGSS